MTAPPLECENCPATENVAHSEFLGVTLCGTCFAKYADERIASTNGDQADDAFGAAATALDQARVDLVGLMRDGIPDREYISGGDGWLLKGKRYLAYSPSGVGKSLGLLVVAVEVVRNGGTVAIIDVENGADEYARRLEAIIGDDDELGDACVKRLRYYAFPALSMAWSEDEWLSALAGCDVVIFDSSRHVLSGLGLAEDGNDDYSRFMARIVMPLCRAGITSVILDNTGHAGDHPRGASAKRDLNEVLYSLTAPDGDLDSETERRLVWRLTRGRFAGAVPRVLEQRIGGGTYTAPKPTEDTDEGGKGAWRPTGYMQRVSQYVEYDDGCSQNAIFKYVEGKEKHIVTAIQALVDEGFMRREDGSNRAKTHHSITPFREADDE